MPFILEASRFEDVLLINVVLDQDLPSGDTEFSSFFRLLMFSNPPVVDLAVEYVGTIDNLAAISTEMPLEIAEFFSNSVDGVVSSDAKPGDVLFAFEFRVLQDRHFCKWILR